MLTCKFADLFINYKPDSIADKVKQYVGIIESVKPFDPDFQKEFATFFTMNVTTWMSKEILTDTGGETDGLTRKEVFFKILNKHLCMGKSAKYENIIKDLAIVPMKDKHGSVQISFASKILHVIDNSKPIIDQKMLLKLLKPNSDFVSSVPLIKSGIKKPVVKVGKGKTFDNKLQDAIDFYDDVCNYYPLLIAANTQYIKDFDSWLGSIGVKPTSISDTKKIDFWMWLA